MGSDGIYQKDGVRLSFEVPAISGWTESINGVDVAGQQLKKVGIEMKVKQVSANEMTELYSKGDFQIITENMWYSGSEPYDFYNTFYASDQTVYDDMPYIPMMRTATMVETSKEYTGWVTKDNVYAAPASWNTWDTGIILRQIKPVTDNK